MVKTNLFGLETSQKCQQSPGSGLTGRVLVAKRRTVVAFGFVSCRRIFRSRVSKLSTVTSRVQCLRFLQRVLRGCESRFSKAVLERPERPVTTAGAKRMSRKQAGMRASMPTRTWLLSGSVSGAFFSLPVYSSGVFGSLSPRDPQKPRAQDRKVAPSKPKFPHCCPWIGVMYR